MLSNNDKNNIKIFKYLKNQIDSTNININKTNATLEDSIKLVEELVKKTGVNTNKFNKDYEKQHIKLIIPKKRIIDESYSDILAKSEIEFGKNTEYGFDDILSSKEIMRAYSRIEDINYKFSKKTKLKDYDLAFVIVATALQSLKWICLPEIGNPFDSADRMAHDDSQIKNKHEQTLNNFRDSHYSKDGDPTTRSWTPQKDEAHRKSWIEILFTKAPYDKIAGSSVLDLGLSGKNHRLKTLGHDPILGWVFGTANFMTDTATLSDFRSFRIRDAHWQNEPVSIGQLFQETVDLTRYDTHCLAAALVAQGAHLASDQYTKMGLPVPFLSTFSPDFASKLYTEHYDSLCLARDCKVIAVSSIISILINMIISFVHGMFYNPSTCGYNKDLYEVRTRKILLISNSIATSSNVIYCYITKNIKRLDIGGLVIAITRMFSDIKFITKIKDEFIQREIDKDLETQMDELDLIYNRICK